MFVTLETLTAFQRHNGLSLSASLAFYAMFALIPMALLMLFLLSHLVVSSDYAIVQLAILTSNLVPKLSQSIMVEVYNISTHRAAWGVLGMLALLWAITPLAGALRSAFHTICLMIETPSFIQRKFKDVLAVLGILLLLFLFTFSGMMLEKVIAFLRPEFVSAKLLNNLSSLTTITLVLMLFYRVFFPATVPVKHLLIGSLLTALLWIAMRPAFELFLFVNQSYGSIFGGMKNMFISIAWLYYSFAVFLLGSELIATLRRKNVLLLKRLFGATPKAEYLNTLMRHFGSEHAQGEFLFREGDTSRDMFYIVSGTIQIQLQGKPLRELKDGAYFGEMAVLTNEPRHVDACVTSERAQILHISADTIETLLIEEPRVALNFLREMALRLRQSGTEIGPLTSTTDYSAEP